jgi:hypothetical protein
VQDTSDKGKAGESRRRKATGLPSQNDHDRQAAEDYKSPYGVCSAWLIKKPGFLFEWLFNLQESSFH